MKKLLFSLYFVVAAFSLHAQLFLNGKPLAEVTKARYLEITTRKVDGSRDYHIVLNYGQDESGKRNMDLLTDANGEPIKFKNIVGALNYFDEYGWEFKDSVILDNMLTEKKYLLIRKN